MQSISIIAKLFSVLPRPHSLTHNLSPSHMQHFRIYKLFWSCLVWTMVCIYWQTTLDLRSNARIKSLYKGYAIKWLHKIQRRSQDTGCSINCFFLRMLSFFRTLPYLWVINTDTPPREMPHTEPVHTLTKTQNTFWNLWKCTVFNEHAVVKEVCITKEYILEKK